MKTRIFSWLRDNPSNTIFNICKLCGFFSFFHISYKIKVTLQIMFEIQSGHSTT